MLSVSRFETHTNPLPSCPVSFHDPSLRLVAEVACFDTAGNEIEEDDGVMPECATFVLRVPRKYIELRLAGMVIYQSWRRRRPMLWTNTA